MAADVVYNDSDEKKESWIRYLHGRIFKKRQNNLITITGPTGSGKSYSGLSIAEQLSKKSGIPFTIEYVVFHFEDFWKLITDKEKTPKGAVILFDEPQVDVDNRDWRTPINKAFIYIMTTFRFRRLTVLFCTPYSSFLDKKARQLFHANFKTMKIDRKERKVLVRPVKLWWHEKKDMEQEEYLKVSWKRKGKKRYRLRKLREWRISEPSKELQELYEKKKEKFGEDLYNDIGDDIKYHKKMKKDKYDKVLNNKELTPFQQQVVDCWKQGIKRQVAIAERLSKTQPEISDAERFLRHKGHNKEDY